MYDFDATDDVEHAAAILAAIVVGLNASLNEHAVFAVIRDFIDDGRFGLDTAPDLIRAIQAQSYNPKSDTLH